MALRVIFRIFRGSLRARGVLAATLLGLMAARCGDPSPGSPSVGTNSNWLRLCTTDADCGKLTCRCGGCSLSCTSDADCSTLTDARCATGTDPGRESACAATAAETSGICLPRCAPGGCTDEQSCVGAGCVPSPMPANAFCTAAAHRALADRTREDEILSLIEQIRAAGPSGCGGTGTTPSPPLRLSTELLCADRVFADDVRTTRSTSQTDSVGRTAPARLMAAGYTPGAWWESTAVGANSAMAAITLMLTDAQACANWTDAKFTDVAVGVAGDSVVVTFGAGG